jgi:hypothetical protein
LLLGSVATPQLITTGCPGNAGFSSRMTCYSTTVSCPGTYDIPLVFGFLAGTPNPSIRGTIVLLPGSSGGSASADGEDIFISGASYYNNNNYPAAGYNVVEMAWGHAIPLGFLGMAWEDTTNDCGNNCPPPVPASSIQAAACRPATFLNYIAGNSNYHTSGTGMCAQGFSGGSGAVGYALAWYAASDKSLGYLDKAVLISGPVFSNIELGCEVPGPIQTFSPVCSGSPAFCPTGNGSWDFAPYFYEGTVAGAMRGFTGDQTCRLTNTSPQSDQNWLNMSIVEGNASFNYKYTVLSGFACGNVASGSGTMNNSSTQAWTFFNNPIITPTNVPYFFYNVLNCSGSEGVYATPNTQVPAINNEPGFNAIFDDMTNSIKTHTQVCTSIPHQ